MDMFQNLCNNEVATELKLGEKQVTRYTVGTIHCRSRDSRKSSIIGYSAVLMLLTAWQGIRGLNTTLYLLKQL